MFSFSFLYCCCFFLWRLELGRWIGLEEESEKEGSEVNFLQFLEPTLFFGSESTDPPEANLPLLALATDRSHLTPAFWSRDRFQPNDIPSQKNIKYSDA